MRRRGCQRMSGQEALELSMLEEGLGRGVRGGARSPASTLDSREEMRGSVPKRAEYSHCSGMIDGRGGGLSDGGEGSSDMAHTPSLEMMGGIERRYEKSREVTQGKRGGTSHSTTNMK